MERSGRGELPPLADRPAGRPPERHGFAAGRQLKQSARQTGLLLGGAALLLLAASLLPPSMAWPGPLLLALTLAGYGALVAFLHLFLFPPRLRQRMPGGAVPLARHRLIADAALAMALLHGLGWLAAEPASWRYLLSSAPLYMLAGLLALLALLLVALTSRHRARQGLSRARLGFRAPHTVLSALSLIFGLLHAVGAGLLLDSAWKTLLCALLASLAIAALLRPAPRGR